MENSNAQAGAAPLTIVIAADGNFSIPLALCVESLLCSANKATRYNIHVLDDGVRCQIKDYLQALTARYHCRITYHNVTQAVQGVAESRQFPKVAFARFLLNDYLGNNESRRIFYTDADVLFCEDLTPLFQMEMGGHAVAAPQAINLISKERYAYLQSWAKVYSLNLDDNPGAYFQSGNLLIDSHLWKERTYGSRILELGMKVDMAISPMPDQDIMNAVCWGDIALLPAKYCVIPLFEKRYERAAYASNYGGRCAYSADELEHAIRRPAVLHYAGVKPQVLQGPRYAGEEAFINFWRQSAWKDYLPYAPPRGSQGAELFLDTSRKLSEQLPILQRKLLKYRLLSKMAWGKRRSRYAAWSDGLANILKKLED